MVAKKTKEIFICQECGASYNKWSGKCSECGAWNSIEQEFASNQDQHIASLGKILNFENLGGEVKVEPRFDTGYSELDRVLGGGIVKGSAILIGGDPGIGKSTLLLQLVSKLVEKGKVAAYVTGEESIEQIKLRALRLNMQNEEVKVIASTNIYDIIATIINCKTLPSVVVIDSIQTMYVTDVSSSPGTMSQVRAATHELLGLAKKYNITVLIVSHVTKEGQIAGPKLLEHMVDTVLYFEGERENSFRILRAVKNRFGSINEIGIFEMQEIGLVEVVNPSALFLTERKTNVSGSAIFAGIEGTRPILVEIQSLVASSQMVAPRRAVVGWDLNRLSMMLAVLSSRFGVGYGAFEVYLNVVGGLKITEPAADLAVVASLLSALKNHPLPNNTIFFGEIGLSGEVRKVSRAEARLKEAAKLGFTKAIVPPNMNLPKNLNIEIEELPHIKGISNYLAG